MILISQLEFIIQNKKDAVQAERYGAARLELVSAASEGGLTPSYGILEQTLDSVSIPIHVVIRPHSFHYFYSDDEMEVILEDIKQVLSLGGNRIVFGALNHDRTINRAAIEAIIELDPAIMITFHGAIDHSVSVVDSYQLLLDYKENIQCVVTTGGGSDVEAGVNQLSEMVKLQKTFDGPVVMPGTGLRINNIEKVHKIVQADIYHFGRGVRQDEDYARGFDVDKIIRINDLLRG